MQILCLTTEMVKQRFQVLLLFLLLLLILMLFVLLCAEEKLS